MASVVFTFNGSTTVTAVITGATDGDQYALAVDANPFPTDSGTVSGGTLTLTCTGLSVSAGYEFDVFVTTGTNPFLLTANYIAATVFQEGSTAEDGIAGTWSFDGSATVSVTGTFANGTSYVLQISDTTNGGSTPTSFVGTGAPQTVTNTAASPATGDYFYAAVGVDDSSGQVVANRMFQGGVADAGHPGNPGGATPIAGLVSIAFSSATLTDTPVWEGVDGNVVSWQIDRGRQSETDTTQTGTAQVTLVDAAGLLDTLNALGVHVGELQPLKQIRLQEIDPRDGVTVVTQFTGFIEDWDWTIDQASKLMTVTLSCVDGFDNLAASEVVPDATGQTAYTRQQVDDAIRARLADAGWPSGLTDVFSGNVYVKPVVYQAGTDILTTLQDCADAEFPGVSNIYISKLGLFTFHGRYARFNPFDPSYGIGVWNCGDATGWAGHDDWGKISELSWRDQKSKIINSCLATPEAIAAQNVPGQLVADSGSIDARGVRALKFEGLLTDGNVNTGTTDLEETLLFAQYYVDNYKTPQPQINRLVFKGRDPADPTESGTWAILLKVELGDVISVVTVDPGGGGFNASFFVEGIHQTCEIGNDRQRQRTCSLDVSPQALYDSNPFVTSGSSDTTAPTTPTGLVAVAV